MFTCFLPVFLLVNLTSPNWSIIQNWRVNLVLMALYFFLPLLVLMIILLGAIDKRSKELKPKRKQECYHNNGKSEQNSNSHKRCNKIVFANYHNHLSIFSMRATASLLALGMRVCRGVAENWGNLKFMLADSLCPKI